MTSRSLARCFAPQTSLLALAVAMAAAPHMAHAQAFTGSGTVDFGSAVPGQPEPRSVAAQPAARTSGMSTPPRAVRSAFSTPTRRRCGVPTVRPPAQVKGIVCGHVHRPVVTSFGAIPLAVCASCAPQVALDLTPIDPEVPDDRAMIVAEAPGIAFHRWTGSQFVTHFDCAQDVETLARFDHTLQPLVRHLIDERPGSHHAMEDRQVRVA